MVQYDAIYFFVSQSKGGILSKACDFIQELRQSNNRLTDELNTLERLRMDNQLLRQEVRPYFLFLLILSGYGGVYHLLLLAMFLTAR